MHHSSNVDLQCRDGAPKVLLVVGASPPDPCGIGDYSHQLAAALRVSGVNVEVLTIRNAKLSGIAEAMKTINRSHADLIHLQYPGLGFGLGANASLLPQLISVLTRGAVTLHEFSQVHMFRRLASSVFAVSARHLIFTNHWEQEAFEQYFRRRSACSVIPIGSNIEAGREEEARVNRIVHFGLIRPRRGLEDVIELGRILADNGSPFHIEVVGSPYPGEERYFHQLLERSARLPIKWRGAMPADALSSYLASSAFAYMPFPDGASERRTSLLALMASGVVTVTRQGPFTPAGWKQGLLFAPSPAAAFTLLSDAHSRSGVLYELRTEVRRLAREYNWDRIADRHISIYRTMNRKFDHIAANKRFGCNTCGKKGYP